MHHRANFMSLGRSAATRYSGLKTTKSVSVPLPDSTKVGVPDTFVILISVTCSKFKSIRKNAIGRRVATNHSREPRTPATTADSSETKAPTNKMSTKKGVTGRNQVGSIE